MRVSYKSRVDHPPPSSTPAIAGGLTYPQSTYGARTASSSSSLNVPTHQRTSPYASRLPQRYHTSASPPRDSPPSNAVANPFALPEAGSSRPKQQQQLHRVIDILSDDDSTSAPELLRGQALADDLFPPNELDADDEMARRAAVQFGPQDPEPGVRPLGGTIGAGWTSGGADGFYADEGARPTRKGSSRAAQNRTAKPQYNFGAAPGFNAAVQSSVSQANKGGGGGRRTQKDVLKSMGPIAKTGRGALLCRLSPSSVGVTDPTTAADSYGIVPPTNFHQQQPTASTSSAAVRQQYKSPIMPQNAPLTEQEIEGRKAQAKMERKLNGKGKGKGKAEVLELDDSDEEATEATSTAGRAHRDEDPNDPISDEDEDRRRPANGRRGPRQSLPHPSTSRTPSRPNRRDSVHGDRFDESQDPSSPDPIGIEGLPTDQAHLGKLQNSHAAVSKKLGHDRLAGRVHEMVADYETKHGNAAGGQPGAVVRGMKGKQVRRDPLWTTPILC